MAYAVTESGQTLAGLLSGQFEKAFARTEIIFDLIAPEAYLQRPIPLRHPFVFYEGHLPAFIWNTLFRRTLGETSFNAEFDRLFERGIDPGDLKAAEAASIHQWPPREDIREYRRMVHERLFDYLGSADFQTGSHPLLKDAYVLWMLLEHELMHQETLLYIVHQLSHGLKKKPPALPDIPDILAPEPFMVKISAGKTTLGTVPGEFPFAWDNEMQRMTVDVAAFEMDAFNTTNGQFLEFVEAGGYENPAYWSPQAWQWNREQNKTHPLFWKKGETGWLLRDFFEDRPLPLSWPVYVSHAEASAYARFVGKELPTEAEWHRAAFGERLDAYPWGSEAPTVLHGNFDFHYWSPVPVGSYPAYTTQEGIHDLAGNGWEWTASEFQPFPGFQASEGYPQYSADFFDGGHFVVKGGSCFTDALLLRRPLRNWYYWHYPYMYATFRCVKR